MSSETVWRANCEVTETIQPSLLPGLQRATDPVGKPKVLHKGILLIYVESSSGFTPSAVFPSLPETDCMGEVIRRRLGSERVRTTTAVPFWFFTWRIKLTLGISLRGKCEMDSLPT